MTNELMLELSSIRAIKASPPACTAMPSANSEVAEEPSIAVAASRRLSIVASPASRSIAARSRISTASTAVLHIEATTSTTSPEHASFEETIWLLLEGELPSASELQRHDGRARQMLAAFPSRFWPSSRRCGTPTRWMRSAPPYRRSPRSILTGTEQGPDAAKRAGLRLIAQVPTLIAAHHALRSGSHASRAGPTAAACTRFPAHAARPRARAGAGAPDRSGSDRPRRPQLQRLDLRCPRRDRLRGRCHAAITAALAAFAGPLHGGAVEQALHQIDRIGAPEAQRLMSAIAWSATSPSWGSGIASTAREDPRVRHFRATAAGHCSRHRRHARLRDRRGAC